MGTLKYLFDSNGMPSKLKILVIDIGGNNVKALATGHKERRKFPSGPKMTPQRMVLVRPFIFGA
jgi:hypothetical protein